MASLFKSIHPVKKLAIQKVWMFFKKGLDVFSKRFGCFSEKVRMFFQKGLDVFPKGSEFVIRKVVSRRVKGLHVYCLLLGAMSK